METTFSQVLNVLLLTAVVCLIREVYKVFTFVNDCLKAFEPIYREIIYNNNDNIKFILLDANEGTIEQRINGRYKTEESKKELKRATNCTVEKFIKNNTSFLATLRNICEKDERCNVVDTINKSSENVAKQVIEIINSKNIHE